MSDLTRLERAQEGDHILVAGTTYRGGTQGRARTISHMGTYPNATYRPQRVSVFYWDGPKAKTAPPRRCYIESFVKWMSQNAPQDVRTIMGEDPFSLVVADCTYAIQQARNSFLNPFETLTYNIAEAFKAAVNHPFCPDESTQFRAACAALYRTAVNEDVREVLRQRILGYADGDLASVALREFRGEPEHEDVALIYFWLKAKESSTNA